MNDDAPEVDSFSRGCYQALLPPFLREPRDEAIPPPPPPKKKTTTKKQNRTMVGQGGGDLAQDVGIGCESIAVFVTCFGCFFCRSVNYHPYLVCIFLGIPSLFIQKKKEKNLCCLFNFASGDQFQDSIY